MSWSIIQAEAAHAFVGEGRFPLPAYSDFMPPPYVGLKPAEPARLAGQPRGPAAFEISEYEQAQELAPGLTHVAARVLHELRSLAHGKAHALSRTLLANNPALGPQRADAPIVLMLSLALSRTQDDKGNVRWTLFGVSHEGPEAAFARSLQTEADLAAFAAWASGSSEGVRVLGEGLFHLGPRFDGSLDGVRTLVTFQPYASLPANVREAHARGALILLPTPSSLVFFEHAGYRALARSLPRATQIPLLHLFQRVEGGYSLRIPQSGWLDEMGAERSDGHRGHRVVNKVVRTHRWQRAAKQDALTGEGAYEDAVSVALFSSKPEDLGLYGKPMARNAQVWTEDYRLLLDGPRATSLEIERACRTVDVGGRFGYRFLFPPMRAGSRELFWHVPLCARLDPGMAEPVMWGRPLGGFITAEPAPEQPDLPRVELVPQLLARPGHHEAATLFDVDPGRPRYTTCHNIRKLLEASEYLGGTVPPSFARALVYRANGLDLHAWLDKLSDHTRDRAAAERVRAQLKNLLSAPVEPGPNLTFEHTAARGFEEKVWRSIASLAEGDFRWKENADGIPANRGKTGGPKGEAAQVQASTETRDLDRLADHLHDRYRALIERHGMTGEAQVVDHCFRWDTIFDFSWSEGWKRNRLHLGHERNVVLVIPGRDRSQAVIMADHYDTAYMEDVHDETSGGDGMRAAAAGADDNHSATTALLCAAEVLLPMARAGRLKRDVWLVHLTGEEFPTDCLGARSLCQALVERRLRFTAEDGAIVDVSKTRVVGAFVLDMIGHNTERERDVFQIAPGEGAGSMRLALRAHLANERWNAAVPAWNQQRRGQKRAERMPDGARPPPPFAHLALRGEVRTEWSPRSSLFNTDGQIFSDVGIPVVLFMENYDISRSGYHDTNDTMKNIDLDYAAAMTAIAIESVADTACADEP